MNKIDLNELKDEKKEIYSFLWANKKFDFHVVLSGKDSHSYEFEFAGQDLMSYVGDSLANNFGIKKDKELFKEKFKMACSGTGDEIKKITTLHSSSLCALLFFFNVTESHPIRIPGYENYVFTSSYFEFKNKVIGFPSNVDIVLLGKNTENSKNVILFLESKFSEYITGIKKANKKYEIGKSYFSDSEDCFSKPIYDSLEKDGLLELKKESKYYLTTKTDKYIEGIKQMISHYYGIRNYINDDFYENDNPCLGNIKSHNAEEILLGEILFDNFGDDIKKCYLKPYEDDYDYLAKLINKTFKGSNGKEFKMLEKSLHYFDLRDMCLTDYPIIKDFYFGNNK